jgi:hypothetical protein
VKPPAGPGVAGAVFSGLSILEMMIYASARALEIEPEAFRETIPHVEMDQQAIFLSLVERKL